jgi:hypothetical protein
MEEEGGNNCELYIWILVATSDGDVTALVATKDHNSDDQ